MKMDVLDIYSDYLISQSHHGTATGLGGIFDGEISYDQASRHLRSGDYGSKELWSYINPEMRRHKQRSGGVLLLDDTLSEKPYTDENAANCWHYSHAKGRHNKLWNRMSSGSYFLPSVKAVPIPKNPGGERILGVPTVTDRIAQMVVKLTFEPCVEPYFLAGSYGYRPNGRGENISHFRGTKQKQVCSLKEYPNLFVHWRSGMRGVFA